MTARRLSLISLLALPVLVAAAYLVSTAVPCAVPPFPVSPGGGQWTAGAALPTPRSELAATALDGRIYVAGGLRGAETVAAFEAYDPAADAWQVLADLPAPLHHTAIAGAGGKVYLTGGYGDLSFGEVSAAAWAYDRARDTWQAVSPMPAPRAAHAMAAIDGKLYVIGGVPDGTALWAYDPASDTWQTGLAAMPTAREHLSVAAADGRLYVAGGRWEGAGNVAALEVYDPASDAWEALPDMPSARGGLTAGAVEGRIYVGGGENPGARLGTGCTYDTLEVYDTAAGEWSRLETMPTARHGLSSAVVAGRWYVIGGATRPTFGTVISVSDRAAIFQPAP